MHLKLIAVLFLVGTLGGRGATSLVAIAFSQPAVPAKHVRAAGYPDSGLLRARVVNTSGRWLYMRGTSRDMPLYRILVQKGGSSDWVGLSIPMCGWGIRGYSLPPRASVEFDVSLPSGAAGRQVRLEFPLAYSRYGAVVEPSILSDPVLIP